MAEKEYIEREAIQKRLNRIVEVNNLRTDLAWFTPYGVKALIEEIPAADVRPVKWIPVTERLPEEMDRSRGEWSAEIRPSDDVLVWLSHEKRQSVAWYSHTYNEWTTVDENTVYCFGEITHWMPLSEPPKEET